MRIISFAVNNFRSISGGLVNNVIEFQDSNTIFLLGQNNVGKSSFLKAYDFFYNNTPLTLEDVNKQSAKTVEFELVLKIDDFDFDKEAIKNKASGLKKWLNEDNNLRIKRSYNVCDAGKGLSIGSPKNLTWDYVNQKWEEKHYGGIGLDNVFKDALPTPIFIKAMPSEEEVELIINKILSEKAKKNLDEKEREELKLAQEKVKELQEKLYNPTVLNPTKLKLIITFKNYFQILRLN